MENNNLTEKDLIIDLQQKNIGLQKQYSYMHKKLNGLKQRVKQMEKLHVLGLEQGRRDATFKNLLKGCHPNIYKGIVTKLKQLEERNKK